MYTLYKFHFLNGISEINQLFDDILIIWPAPVYIYIYIYIYILLIILISVWLPNKYSLTALISATVHIWCTFIKYQAAR